MPPPQHQLGLAPSILDRLIDPESAGTAIMTGYSAEKMYRAVLRDLEDLLNTRRTAGTLPASLDEVSSSIVAFGLPDISSTEAGSTSARQDIAIAIRAVIDRFEPRLQDVSVVPAQPRRQYRPASRSSSGWTPGWRWTHILTSHSIPFWRWGRGTT